MKYFMRTTPDPDVPASPPTPEMMARMGAFIAESFQNGSLVSTGGLDPRTIRVRSSGGTVTFTDGPFTEAKEAVVGWAIIEAESREQAIEYCRRFWDIVGDGAGTIQRLYDPGEIPNPVAG